MTGSFRTGLLGIVIASAVGAPLALAADADDARQGPKYHLAMGQTYARMAAVHAKILKNYAAAGKTVPAEVIQEHTAAMTAHVESAKKSIAKLSTAAKSAPGMDKQVAEMQARLDKVSQQLKLLKAQAAQEKTDSAKVLAETKTISKQLAEANQSVGQTDKKSYDSDSWSYYSNGLGGFWGSDSTYEDTD